VTVPAASSAEMLGIWLPKVCGTMVPGEFA
jgi:hypothetical protein